MTMIRVIRTIQSTLVTRSTSDMSFEVTMISVPRNTIPRYRGIDGVHVGVELLYEHIGTPQGFLTKRSPSLRAKHTR